MHSFKNGIYFKPLIGCSINFSSSPVAFPLWWAIFCLFRCCISSHGFTFLLVRYWPREKVILGTLNGGESHLIRCLLVFVLLKQALMRCFTHVSSWIFWDGTSLTRCYIMFQFDILSLGYWLTMQIRFPPLHFPICFMLGTWFPLPTVPVGSDTELGFETNEPLACQLSQPAEWTLCLPAAVLSWFLEISLPWF